MVFHIQHYQFLEDTSSCCRVLAPIRLVRTPLPYRGQRSGTVDLLVMSFLEGVSSEALLIGKMRKEACGSSGEICLALPLFDAFEARDPFIGVALLAVRVGGNTPKARCSTSRGIISSWMCSVHDGERAE